MNSIKRNWGWAVVAMVAVLLAAAPAEARRVVVKKRSAVIVVGKPRVQKRVIVINGSTHGTLDMNVQPKNTQVYVDGVLRGTCDRFDGFPNKLHLLPGVHRIRLVTPDGLAVRETVRVRSGREYNIGLDLR